VQRPADLLADAVEPGVDLVAPAVGPEDVAHPAHVLLGEQRHDAVGVVALVAELRVAHLERADGLDVLEALDAGFEVAHGHSRVAGVDSRPYRAIVHYARGP
jgi:hypothetical protein